MRLLVLGGAGYIGSVVVEKAIEAGHDVTALDNLVEGHAAAVHPAARFVRGDAGDPAVLNAVFADGRFDAVAHLAAETTIATSMTDPGRYFRNNTAATLTLLDAMRAHAVMRLVFSSTAAVYGEPEATPIVESHPTRPINAYGESKLMCERIMAWYARAYGLRFVAFRYFNAAGATLDRGEAHRHESHLIPLAIAAALEERPFSVHGLDYPTVDGSCVRDFVHVMDIADAHLRALDRVDAIGAAVFNLGTSHGYTVLQVLQEVERVSGRPVRWTPSPRRPGDPAVLVADGSSAHRALRWTPASSSLTDILDSAWRWTLSHPRGYGD
jgi:UDP-glucose 4-epimerase